MAIELTAKEDIEESLRKFRQDLREAFTGYNDDYSAKQEWDRITTLSARTLLRYLKGETNPIGDNTLKSYMFILNEKDASKAKLKMPQHALFLYDKGIKKLSQKSTQKITENILKTNMHYKIFFSTMGNNVIEKKDFIKKWGEAESLDAINYLEKNEIIEQFQVGFFRRGKVNTDYSLDDIYNLSKYLLANEVKLEELKEDRLGTMLFIGSLSLSKEGLKAQVQNTWRYINDSFEIEKKYPGPNHYQILTGSLSTQRENLQ